ncbi:type II CRISPR RNA-guided endonuclease Cas9 [Flavobacterium covae]|uniref:CRISPR-associated endonuclease Cas9 n=1 Tax=Flavobacterium covae TaxID=2906076 RepID=A0ABW8PI06_9FLAO|nr:MULTISPECIES: type II CRISPR RNA-guided endonuclease Cas9 [Flavobacterium]OWP81340.1 type II CRISPR RNA-guided endonuclease Cas9 [Flavobacterium covae]OXA77651.1 type II CRISPR RNA-guided endonuclease Cas9 [Flavobacterium columnare NBRC 100251 = ATCC 23463]POR22699.1 type II CRISPR RNA-guided endonuclease Cas9 [Flavobacterium columnare]
MTKFNLGLDIGTNSIGWALVNEDCENKKGKILAAGSRIIPMTQDILDKFGSGAATETQTALRTDYRSKRKLIQRFLLRRERLHRVLNVLDFLPKHYAESIDFEKYLGKFLPNTEPKLVYNQNQFIFQNSFFEMLKEFQEKHPELFLNNQKIPYDWTIYYLRKKALSQKIEKEELAWLLLQFNQKRGYNQLRDEEEENTPDKLVEFYSLKIIKVTADEAKEGINKRWYSINLENGWIYRRESKTPLFNWEGKTKNFIVTTDLNQDGSIKKDKEGKEKRSFRAPSEGDWTLLKKKTEKEIYESGKTLGTYIYDALLNNPDLKIKGALIKTIDRSIYKEELQQIINKQKEYHSELNNSKLYKACLEELYPKNEIYKNELKNKDIAYLFINDILYYQRPLKAPKYNIGKCSYESRTFKKEDKKITEFIPAVAKSHPLFQEFRLWQWIKNLKIYEKLTNDNYTDFFLTNERDIEKLFDFLWNKKEIDHKGILEYLIKTKFPDLKPKQVKSKVKEYRWNYIYDHEKDESKNYPCGETYFLLKNKLDKITSIQDDFLNKKRLDNLWHIIYSVTDKKQYEKALAKFALKNQLDTKSFVNTFKRIPAFKNDYAIYSLKAIKKLLPLMRVGKYWNYDDIDPITKQKIQCIITGEENDTISTLVREKTNHFSNENDFKNLSLWLAGYIVYNSHNESSEIEKWKSPQDIDTFLKKFKQHALRNPIVEQVVTETLRVVRDIWLKKGQGKKDFFNEIHIELGKDLKNPVDKRRKISSTNSKNETTNIRIKALLKELLKEGIENIKPNSPKQQEILKIFEEGILNSGIDIEEEIIKISQIAQPTKKQLQYYRNWLEQKYISPYTGQFIPLSKLFTSKYEIEHIIPRSKYYDDSLSNKVICETEINRLKNNQLGYEFINNHEIREITLEEGKTIRLLSPKQYLDFVTTYYGKNKAKRENLLLKEIPIQMIENQLNDTRYVSKYVMQLLSKIVRKEDGTDNGTNSINILSVSGKITRVLKTDWGLNDVWNDLLCYRFERLNKITNTNLFTTYSEQKQKIIPIVPDQYAKGFHKKKLDHRHHALDAILIACITRNHINYMNNQNIQGEKLKNFKIDKHNYHEIFQKSRLDMRAQLCEKKYNDHDSTKYTWVFTKPWADFTENIKDTLEFIIPSFKQNLRIINKTVNYYEKYNENGKKVKVRQTKGDNWAIRKPLHKETISGKVHLLYKTPAKGKILTATRKVLDSSMDFKSIEKITDTGIQKILKNYLKYKESPELAFSPEGIEELNITIAKYNDGFYHKPIYKVRIYEEGVKFPLGNRGNKKNKYVEAEKGTNLFFAIYKDQENNRYFETIPFNDVLETLKKGMSAVPEKNQEKNTLVFALSPQDLVFVPTLDEIENPDIVDFRNLTKDQTNRIYKMVSSSGKQCFFIKAEVATSIVNKMEFTTSNKMENSIEGIQIKSNCWKLKLDRLGTITRVIK